MPREKKPTKTVKAVKPIKTTKVIKTKAIKSVREKPLEKKIDDVDDVDDGDQQADTNDPVKEDQSINSNIDQSKEMKEAKETKELKATKKRASNKYKFTLTGINMDKIDQKFSLTQGINVFDPDFIPENVTKLDDLEMMKKTPEVISFLDESKKLKKCFVSMIDIKTGLSVSKNRRYKCFWDRDYLPEGVCPIGCPIKYVAPRATKNYFSEISKEKYIISESITERRATKIENSNDPKFSVEFNDYYETDCFFCSFNCCMAFINSPEAKHEPLYKNSYNLLLKMYNEIHPDEEIEEILPAPHWRTLNEFGGFQTIEKYRENFNKVEYIDRGIISYMAIGRLFEDRLKF